MLYTTRLTMKNLAIEVKFYVEEIVALRKRLIDASAKSDGRMFEKNICLDNTISEI